MTTGTTPAPPVGITIRLITTAPPPDYPDPEEWIAWGPREYLALDGTEQVGFLAWHPVGPDGEDLVCIRKIAVDEDRERQGIASALMDQLVADHPDEEIYMDRFLPAGRAWFTAYLAARPHLDPTLFTEHLDPDL